MDGSTPSKTKKETSSRGGTGNVEVPASPERVNVRWMNVRSECDTTGSSGTLAGNRSRRAGLREGADVAVGERTTGRKGNGDVLLGCSGRTTFRREQCDVDGVAGGGGRVNSVISLWPVAGLSPSPLAVFLPSSLCVMAPSPSLVTGLSLGGHPRPWQCSRRWMCSRHRRCV